jgi:hypothetical protein
MSIYFASVIGASAVMFALGLLLGWRLGVARQMKVDRDDVERQLALRMNAKFDFDRVRIKADQIVDLANDIAKAAQTAQDTVFKSFSVSRGEPGAPAGRIDSYSSKTGSS